jgi:Holliday junction resolvasome RuvABC endonuclease subunit
MIIAIDPSINHVGWARTGGKADAWQSGVLKVKGERVQDKLQHIRQLLVGEFSGRIPGTAVIEIPGKITYQRSTRYGKALNAEAIHKLCYAVGAICPTMADLGLVVETAIADQWKRSFCRSQFAAGKDYFMVTAQQITGRPVRTDHEADAICLAWWWQATQGGCER